MNRLHQVLAVLAAALGLAAAADLGPARDRSSTRTATSLDARSAVSVDTNAAISAPDLADLIIRGEAMLHVFDLRTPAEYAQFHVPGAVLKTAGDLAGETFPSDAHIVLYAGSGTAVADAVRALRARGQTNVRYLREGIYEWIARVHEPRLAIDATDAERTDFERAAARSRFFGGVPRASVPRAEVPAGYWTGAPRTHELLAAAAGQAVAAIRRRGC